MKRLGAFLLALLLTAALLPAAAWGESETVICDAEGLRAFCEACRRESYSDGRSFRLENDIELHGEALCVPIFAGRFDGGGHTVSGLLITGDGSRQGFFRETTDAAEISCLHVSGTVETAGTGMYVGGVVGLNAITIYVAQPLFSLKHTRTMLLGRFAGLFPEQFSGLFLEIGYLALCWLLLLFLHKRKIYLKV